MSKTKNPDAEPVDDLGLSEALAPLSFEVEIHNLTSKTEDIIPGSVVEWHERGVEAVVPPRTFASGHQLQGRLLGCRGEVIETEMEFTGRALSATVQEDQSIALEIEFIQFSDTDWKLMMKSYEDRQKEILEFLAAATGR